MTMTGRASVVTPQRFAEGFSYQEYLSQIKVNKLRFQQYYDDFEPEEGELGRFRSLAGREGGPAKVLAIGEDWCPDVYRGLPTMAKLADSVGVEVRVFPRDSNLDVMNEFLKEGKYQSIPVFVFYTEGLEYICHWIERPEVADRESGEIEAAIRYEEPGIDDRRFGIERRKRVSVRFPAWQAATLREINDMLKESLDPSTGSG